MSSGRVPGTITLSKSNLLSSSSSGNDLEVELNHMRDQKSTIPIKRFSIVDTVSESSGSVHIDNEGRNERSLMELKLSQNGALTHTLMKDLASMSSESPGSSGDIQGSPRQGNDIHLDDEQRNAKEKMSWLHLYSRDTARSLFSSHDGKDIVLGDDVPHISSVGISVASTSVGPGECKKETEMTKDFIDEARGPISVFNHSSLHPHHRRKDGLVDLYNRGVRSRKRLEEKRESIRTAREEKIKAYTFQPKITKKAKAIQRPKSDLRYYEHDSRIRQRLLLEAWRSESDGQCQPTPTISKGSERIVRRVRGNKIPVIPVEERLHLDSARRQCRKAEEDVKECVRSVRRSSDDIKAHINYLYTYEEKRQLALQKLREEIDMSHSQNSLHVDSEEVVRRLARPPEKIKCGHSTEENLIFTPRLSSVTEELSRRAGKRRMEQWYRFFTQTLKDDVFPPNAIANKVREALMLANFTDDLSIDGFCSALDDYEKTHGIQLWHFAPPPSPGLSLNEELTFVPRINPRRMSRETPQPVHDRLFSVAKKQQLTIREKERMQQEEAAVAKEKKRKKQQKYEQQYKQRQKQQGSGSSQTVGSMDREACIGEETRDSPLLCPPNEAPQSDVGHLYECDFSVVSPASVDSWRAETNSVPHHLSTISLCPQLLDAAEKLCGLVNVTEEKELKCTSTLFSQEVALPAENTKPSCPVVESAEVLATPSSVLPISRVCKKSHRVRDDLPVSADVLLECALSRASWSADIATRRRELCEGRRRLQGLGKMLYRKM